MSTPALKNRPAALPRSTTPAVPRAAAPKTSAPASKDQPWTGTPQSPSQQRRGQDAFDAAVAKLPAAPAADPSALSQRGAKTLEQTRALLSGLLVTEGNAKEALASLGALEPRDFKLATERLSSSGHLATLLDKLPVEGRSQFLSVAAGKGCLRASEGKATPGAFNPPRPPTLYLMEKRFPACLNDAIHAQSERSFSHYKQDFQAYVGRYADAAKQAGSEKALAALGHPVSPSSARLNMEPGVANENAYRGALDNSWPSTSGAYAAVSERLGELSGKRQDGAAWLEVNVEFTQPNGVAGEFSATSDGQRHFVAGPALGTDNVTLKQLGEQTSVKVKSESAEVELKTKGGKLEEVAVKLATNGLAGEVGLDREGKASFSALSHLKLRSAEAEAGVYTTASPHEAEMTAGVVGEVKFGTAELKVKLGLGSKGITRHTTRDAVTGKSIFSGK